MDEDVLLTTKLPWRNTDSGLIKPQTVDLNMYRKDFKIIDLVNKWQLPLINGQFSKTNEPLTLNGVFSLIH